MARIYAVRATHRAPEASSKTAENTHGGKHRECQPGHGLLHVRISDTQLVRPVYGSVHLSARVVSRL